MKLNIGMNLYQCRKQANLTKKEAADKFGVFDQSVRRWENGATYPDLELLPAISGIFQISVNELFGLPNQKKEMPQKTLFTKLLRLPLKPR